MDSQDFGILFKKFRERKGMKTSEVAEGIVSVQFLRRFEKGESDIKLSNFFQLLNRINVSFGEFMFETKLSSIDFIVEGLEKQFDKIITSSDTIGLNQLIQYFLAEYKETNEEKYLHFYIVSKIVFNQYFNGVYPIEIEHISSYLNKCDTWCKYEYFIANYSVTAFDNDKLYILSKLGLNMSMKNRNTRHYLVDFIIHSCMEFILRDNDDYAIEILELYKNNTNIKPILQYLSFNIVAKFLESMVKAKDGDEESVKECDNIIYFFYNTVGYVDYANKMQKFYNKILVRNEKI